MDTGELRERVWVLVLMGWSDLAIAEHLKCPPSVVAEARATAGLPPIPASRNSDDSINLEARYPGIEAMTRAAPDKEVAAQFGLPQVAVKRYRERFGIPKYVEPPELKREREVEAVFGALAELEPATAAALVERSGFPAATVHSVLDEGVELCAVERVAGGSETRWRFAT